MALKSLCVCSMFTAFSVFFRLAKMARTSPLSFSSRAAVRCSTEQAMSMVMDDQSSIVLAADSDGGPA